MFLLYCSRVRCSKFRGELTSWSSSVEPLGVQPFPTLGVFPFIVQGGASIYIYLALCLGTVECPSSTSVVRAHSVSREWGGLILVGFRGQRVVQALSHPWPVGAARSFERTLGAHLQSYLSGSMSLICRATLHSPCPSDSTPDEGCLTEAKQGVSGHTRWHNRVARRGSHHYGAGGDVR